MIVDAGCSAAEIPSSAGMLVEDPVFKRGYSVISLRLAPLILVAGCGLKDFRFPIFNSQYSIPRGCRFLTTDH